MIGPLILLAALAASAPDQVIATSRIATVIPPEIRLAEAIAVDRGRMFTGSVVDGGLWMRTAGRWRLVAPRLPKGAVLALAVDPVRKRLWASIGRAEPSVSVSDPFIGLVALDLRSLEPIARVTMPDGALPFDLAVGADGTAYVSEQANGGVYRCRPGCRVVERMLDAKSAPSPQGIAPGPGGSLYLADYGRGILRIDRAGDAEPLANPGGRELRGLDALLWWRGGLIGVQNGTRTKRILRIALSLDGRTAERVEPIEQGHPEWGDPTLATIDGGRLFYVADAQWEAWEARGRRKDGVPLRGTPVRTLPLGSRALTSALR